MDLTPGTWLLEVRFHPDDSRDRVSDEVELTITPHAVNRRLMAQFAASSDDPRSRALAAWRCANPGTKASFATKPPLGPSFADYERELQAMCELALSPALSLDLRMELLGVAGMRAAVANSSGAAADARAIATAALREAAALEALVPHDLCTGGQRASLLECRQSLQTFVDPDAVPRERAQLRERYPHRAEVVRGR